MLSVLSVLGILSILSVQNIYHLRNFQTLCSYDLPTNQHYQTKLIFHYFLLIKLPGLCLESILFVLITYFLAQLRPTWYAFGVTVLAATLVINVSTACGCFFSAAFSSVPLAMAYLVPFDYILMITSGIFVKISTLPQYLSWMPFISWIMYANEAMSIVQWEGVTNISKFTFISQILILAPRSLSPQSVIISSSDFSDFLTFELLPSSPSPWTLRAIL